MEVNITMTVKDVELVLGCLAKLPLEQSADTFFSIKTQAELQIAEARKSEQQEIAVGGTH
jgi:hypothetical protein